MKSILKYLLPLFFISTLLPIDASAQIEWLQKEYDFGLMKEAAGPAKGKVQFINRGKEEVIISGARPSCGCTSVEYPEEPIAPGDTAVISFIYDPTGRPGKFDKSIRVFIGEHDTYRIGIKGNVLGTPESLDQFYPFSAGALRVSMKDMAGGEMRHGVARNYFINAYNQSTDSINPSIDPKNKALKAEISQKRLGPGDVASISLYFNSAEVENIGDIEIPIVLSDGKEDTEPLTVTFKANVTPDFSRLTPEQVDNGPRCYLLSERADVGIVTDNDSRTLSFSIQNQGKTKMNIIKIAPPSKALTVKKKPTVIKPGKDGEAVISINPAMIEKGAFNLSVRVLSDDPLHPIRVLHVVGIKE